MNQDLPMFIDVNGAQPLITSPSQAVSLEQLADFALRQYIANGTLIPIDQSDAVLTKIDCTRVQYDKALSVVFKAYYGKPTKEAAQLEMSARAYRAGRITREQLVECLARAGIKLTES